MRESILDENIMDMDGMSSKAGDRGGRVKKKEKKIVIIYVKAYASTCLCNIKYVERPVCCIHYVFICYAPPFLFTFTQMSLSIIQIEPEI